VPGTRVEVLRVAPLGDPVELLVRGASLSIRRAEAKTRWPRRASSRARARPIPEEQPVMRTTRGLRTLTRNLPKLAGS